MPPEHRRLQLAAVLRQTSALQLLNGTPISSSPQKAQVDHSGAPQCQLECTIRHISTGSQVRVVTISRL